jgi:hypothetical protein
MEKDNMTLLLEKYWRAETTIEEEKLIKQYFAAREQDALTQNDHWFKVIRDFQSIESNVVDFTASDPANNIKKFNLSIVLKIASTVMLILGATLFGINYHNRKIQAEKELAIRQEAEASLLFISKVINQANNDLDQSAGYILSLKKSNQ